MSQPQQVEEEEFTGSNLKESEESKNADAGASEGGAKGGEEADAKKESKRPDDTRTEESKKPTTVGPDSRVSVWKTRQFFFPYLSMALGFSGGSDWRWIFWSGGGRSRWTTSLPLSVSAEEADSQFD